MEKILKIIKNREKLVSDAPDYFVEKLESIQNKIYRELQLLIKGMDAKGANLEASKMNIAMANSLRVQVKKWMRDNGYYAEVSNLGKKYEELIKQSKSYYKELGLDPAFLDRDLKTLGNIRKEDLNFLMAKDKDVVNTVYNEVINSVYSKADWRTLSDRLKGIVTDSVVGGKKVNGLLKKYAATYAQTAFAAFDRKAQNIKAAQYEIDYFLYSGSLIVDSREFCAQRAGKIFTRAEINSWQDMSWKGKASGRDIWTYLGGWNCRHILTPVSEAMAEELEVENLKIKQVSPDVFIKKIKNMLPKNLLSMTTEYTAEDYKEIGANLYITKNGKAGYGITKDKELINLFSAPKATLGKQMILDAIKNGVEKLDCFDTNLPELYKKFGFEEYRRIRWDEKYAPKDWDKEKFGEPDIVFMKINKKEK